MKKFKSYLSLIKFSHTIFAMPFALIGFFLAFVPVKYLYFGEAGEYELISFIKKNHLDFGLDYYPINLKGLILRFLLVILCMVFARSAAMAFNRYLDRHFDAKNPRTAIREIPAGTISASNALAFTIISSLLFIAATNFINRICFYL